MTVTEKIRLFKERLSRGESVTGPFMKTGDPAFVEAAGYAGFDFCILDMEHGPVSLENMQNNVRAASLTGMVPIVRVRDKSPESISQPLDIGAFGVQVPQVSTAEQARAAVAAARFFPEGERGVCRFVRAAEYSMKDRKRYFSEANEALVVLQLEGTEAIENIDSILEVRGYDILFIGPYDLSQSLGVPGDTMNPVVVEAMQGIISRAAAKGICVGTFTDTPQILDFWKKAGVQYLSYSVDVGIFAEACRSIAGLSR